MNASEPARGFSLIETLIAMAILITGCAVLVHLAVVSTRARQAASSATRAALLAANLAEELSSQLTLSGAPSLPLSPADALGTNVAGYCDFFDAAGVALGQGPAPPSGAAYVRRWAVRDLSGGPAGTRLVEITVLPWPEATGLAPSDARRLEFTRLLLLAGP